MATAPAKATSAPPIQLKAANRAATLLKNLSDPGRIQILCLLADGERNVGQMCAAVGQRQPAVSYHLALLRHSGVIEPRRSGKAMFYSLNEKGRLLAQIVDGVMKEDAGR